MSVLTNLWLGAKFNCKRLTGTLPSDPVYLRKLAIDAAGKTFDGLQQELKLDAGVEISSVLDQVHKLAQAQVRELANAPTRAKQQASSSKPGISVDDIRKIEDTIWSEFEKNLKGLASSVTDRIAAKLRPVAREIANAAAHDVTAVSKIPYNRAAAYAATFGALHVAERMLPSSASAGAIETTLYCLESNLACLESAKQDDIRLEVNKETRKTVESIIKKQVIASTQQEVICALVPTIEQAVSQTPLEDLPKAIEEAIEQCAIKDLPGNNTRQIISNEIKNEIMAKAKNAEDFLVKQMLPLVDKAKAEAKKALLANMLPYLTHSQTTSARDQFIRAVGSMDYGVVGDFILPQWHSQIEDYMHTSAEVYVYHEDLEGYIQSATKHLDAPTPSMHDRVKSLNSKQVKHIIEMGWLPNSVDRGGVASFNRKLEQEQARLKVTRAQQQAKTQQSYPTDPFTSMTNGMMASTNSMMWMLMLMTGFSMFSSVGLMASMFFMPHFAFAAPFLFI